MITEIEVMAQFLKTRVVMILYHPNSVNIAAKCLTSWIIVKYSMFLVEGGRHNESVGAVVPCYSIVLDANGWKIKEVVSWQTGWLLLLLPR